MLIFLMILFFILVCFILTLGDGKYASKRLIYHIYNIFGPKIFSSRSEKDKWISIYNKLNIDCSSRILDVGTATGDLPIALASFVTHTGKIEGIDWSDNMIEHAKQLAKKADVSHKVEFKMVDIRDGLPYQDNSFDVLFCIGLLEGYHNYHELIEELIRVVSKNGMIILGLYKSGVRISKERYSKQLKNYGFLKIEVTEFRKTHDLLIARH